jgi:hypothetical protein
MAQGLKPGDRFRHPFLKGPNFRPKCHIVAFVDEDHVVFKWYGRHKQWWHYEVRHVDFLEMDSAIKVC